MAAQEEAQQQQTGLDARVRYLEDVDNRRFDLEDELEDKIYLLKAEYKKKFETLHKQLCDAVSGNRVVVNGKVVEPRGSKGKQRGIPDFWLKALQRHPEIDDLITGRDAEVLKYLTGISKEDPEPSDVECMLGCREVPEDHEIKHFVLYFAKNPFFTNEKLIKTLISYRGLHERRTRYGNLGCVIKWKSPARNVMIKVVKLQNQSSVAAPTKEVPVASFFTFFDDPTPHADRTQQWMHQKMNYDLKIIRILTDICARPVESYMGVLPPDLS